MRHDCLMLVTDYGTEGGFVGVLHGVAERIAPGLSVIDLDHAIPPQDVRLGALRLQRTVGYLPSGVHVGVVDPGVGGERRGVALSAAGGERLFVGPDNGLLCWAAEACGGVEEAVVLDREEWWLAPRSATFDGRDIFVPVGAHLANGVPLAELGSALDPGELVRLPEPVARRLPDASFELDVLQVDHFGNVQLAGSAETVTALGASGASTVAVELGAGPAGIAAHLGRTFGDVEPGDLVLLVDSDGCPALSVNRGSAAQALHLEVHSRPTVRLAPGGDVPPGSAAGSNRLSHPAHRLGQQLG